MTFLAQKVEEQRWKAQVASQRPCLGLNDPGLMERDAHANQRGIGKQHYHFARPQPERRRLTPPHSLSLHSELSRRPVLLPVHQREHPPALALSLGKFATAQQ